MPDRQTILIVSEMKRTAAEVVKKLTLDVTANLIETTPVDTGHARANWVPKIGQPERGEQASAAAQVAGQAAVATATAISQPVYVSNNVPYITRLNDGSSTQAPKGFVQRAIRRAIKMNSR